MSVVPDKEAPLSKKAQVEKMFDHISPRYDLLNHLFSLNIDKRWRKRAIKLLGKYRPGTILDVATGTADFALAASALKPRKIVGIDLSEGMLRKGREKIERRGLSGLIHLQKGDSEELPFLDNSFDAALVGFGVRNFEHPERGLAEICRVLNPGGVLFVLEFALPRNAVIHSLYSVYFTWILPFLGRIFSNHRHAYSYLPDSVRVFPHGEAFLELLKNAGFEPKNRESLSLGIASLYEAQKPEI